MRSLLISVELDREASLSKKGSSTGARLPWKDLACMPPHPELTLCRAAAAALTPRSSSKQVGQETMSSPSLEVVLASAELSAPMTCTHAVVITGGVIVCVRRAFD